MARNAPLIIQSAHPAPTGLRFKNHAARLRRDIITFGADLYDLILPETRTLPYVIHPDEQIQGLVYGRYKQDHGAIIGRGVFVATDQRVLLLDKKPLFVHCDEIAYRVVSGIDYARVGFMGNITLHTRIGDIRLRTFNQKCARSFVEAVEANIFREMPVYTAR